tara:strand:+ start:447 stop:1706 length:1260 start_codon:yes stop_codon:yes gene_type:complete
MTIEIKGIENIEKIEKPWGYEKWIADGAPDFQYALKEIFFKAGHSSSIQFHEVKEETSYVQKGSGILFYYPENIDLEKYKNNGYTDTEIQDMLKNFKQEEIVPGMVYHIKPGTIHRIKAITDLTVIESSTIELDDVIRINDEWGRRDGIIPSEHKPIFRPIDFYFAQDERIEFACKFAKGVVLFCSHGINSQYLISKILLENGADEVWHYDSKLDQRITIRKMNDGKIEMEEKKKFSDINDETFDCILTFEELQFQEKRNELLQTYKKILKNDGTLILSTRNKLSSAEARILPKFDHHKSELDKFFKKGVSKNELMSLITPLFSTVEMLYQREVSNIDHKFGTSTWKSKLTQKIASDSKIVLKKLDKNEKFYKKYLGKFMQEYRKKEYLRNSSQLSVNYIPKKLTNEITPQIFLFVCKK